MAVSPKAMTSEQGYSLDSWGIFGVERTPELTWPNSVEVYDRMRREDAQIRSILSAATLPIRRTRWFVDPNGAPDEVVTFVARNLGLPVKGSRDVPARRGPERFSWDDHLRLALLELTFGHSFFEQVYRIGDDGRAWLRRLGWRPPRTIMRVNVELDGGLGSIEQYTEMSPPGQDIPIMPKGTDIVPKIPVEQLVAYVNDREGGNWLGQSVLRPAYKFWLLKDRLLRVQAQTIDRNGMGVPTYTAPDPTTLRDLGFTPEEAEQMIQDQIDAGLDLARGLRSGENSGASIPWGAKLELRGVSGTLPDALPVIRYYDEQISSAVLANFLKLGGADSTGSYALGTTFADFFVMSLQSEALHIADVTNMHVVNDLVDINYGPDVPAPKIDFEEIGTQQHATAAGIAQLVGSGALLPEPELEAYLRDMFDIPPKTVIRNPNPTPAAPPAQNRAGLLAAQLHQLAIDAGWTAEEAT